MKHSDFIKEVSKLSGFSQSDVKLIIGYASSVLKDTVKNGDEASLQGVGKFTKKIRPEHEGINPATKERITIPESVTVTFKPSKEFKEHLNYAGEKIY